MEGANQDTENGAVNKKTKFSPFTSWFSGEET